VYYSHFPSTWPPSTGKQLAGIAITFVPGFFVGLSLFRLRQLFQTYAQGDFFSARNVQLYNPIASAVLGFVLSWIVAESALSVLLSWGSGQTVLSVSFTHSHAIAVFAALVLRVVTWIMAAGHALEVEKQSFV
jgi:hypothetical protein